MSDTPTTDLAPAEDKTSTALARVQVGTGSKVAAFVPTSLEETWRLAQIISASKMAPKSYDNDPNKVMVGIMAGLELGLTPFTALQSIAVIGNNPSVWGDGALALVEASGLLEYHHESFDERANAATCVVKRLGKPSETTRSFSFEDAKKANLLGKQGPWQGYPKRMCQMRARAWALRDTFADVLKGIGIAEEVRDHTPIGETRSFGGDVRPALTAALVNAQASGENRKIDTINEGTGEIIDAEPVQSSIPAWLGEETRLIDAIHFAADRPSLDAVEKDFLKVKATFPEEAAAKMQQAIDDRFSAIALED